MIRGLDRRSVIRIAAGATVGLVFGACLLGILLTGPIVVPQQRLELDVSPQPARLRADVARLCNDFGPRDYREPANLDLAAEWIAAEMRAAGLETEFQEFTLREGTFRNVVGFRRGSEEGSPVTVLGAHYDAYGGFPGADDNASGVAVLLETARTLPQGPPRFGQYFVAFAAEEPPFFGTNDMGSYAFAEHLYNHGIDVYLMIALDMVGVFSDEPGSQRFPVGALRWLYPETGDFVAVTANPANGLAIRWVKQGMIATRALPVHSFRAPAWVDGVDWSDHLSFWKFDVPAVLVTDTSFFRNPRYHTREDTPDTLDYEAMANVVRALHGALWNNGGAPLQRDKRAD